MPPTQRRRLDVEERRRAILDAAAGVYAAGSYSSVSMSQVAAACGSSQALVFHYFGNKAGLYAAVVAEGLERLHAAQAEAVAALPAGVPVRDRVGVSLRAYLDHIAARPEVWAGPLRGGEEPVEAQRLRSQARAGYVADLAEILGVSGWPRHTFALWGFFGFVDQACLHWVDEGCPADARGALLDASLGALEGALGDWAV